MSLYLMTDVHGEYKKFLNMLEKIGFKDDDELIILGDIFDRGDQPLEVLEYIVSHKNIKLILGNHEQMFLDCYDNGFTHDVDIWHMNGGGKTYEALMEKGQAYIDECAKYLKRQPLYMNLSDRGYRIILCHAGIAVPPKPVGEKPTIEEIIKFQTRNDWLWNRDHVDQIVEIKDGLIICGHTPVQTIEAGEVNAIKRGDIIYLDCGACFEDGRLACARIDTDDSILDVSYVE